MDPQLRERLRAAASRVFPGHGILAAYAHGSRVSGRPRPDSDLDIGYYLLPRGAGAGLPLKVEAKLAADLSRELALDVDLRDLGPAPLELRGRVMEEGVRVYSGDDVSRVALERSTLSYYHDYKDVFASMHEERLGRRRAGGAR